MGFDRLNIHEKVLIGGLTLSIIALPFSISICHIGLIVIAINWVIEGNWFIKWKLASQNYLVIFFAMYFCWLAVGVSYSDNIENAWFNVEKKFSFVLVPIVLVTSGLSAKHKHMLLMTFILTCFVGTLICFGSAIHRIYYNSQLFTLNFGAIQPELLLSNPLFSNNWQHFSYVALASGIGIHPTYLSIYLIFCICLLIAQLINKTLNKYLIISMITYFTIFLALLSTKIVVLAILLVCTAIILMSLINSSIMRAKKTIITISFVFLFMALTALNPISLYRDFQEINSTHLIVEKNATYSNSTEIRFTLWWAGLKTAWTTNPIIGSGTGDTLLEISETLKTNNISNILNTSDPHNQFIYTYISTGLIGLILLLGCLLSPLRYAWKAKNLLHIVFIALVLLASSTESFLESQKGIMFFVLFQFILYINPWSSTKKLSIQ
ncbi:MAG TPA: hypothetical protein DCQ58_06990 [Saprospirales bacterium]|nr:hypothetical protein [Saprospirales bacterium]